MKFVKPHNIYESMRVVNSAGVEGTVEDCSDYHNVYVKFDNYKWGYYCILEYCKEFEMNLDDMLYVKE